MSDKEQTVEISDPDKAVEQEIEGSPGSSLSSDKQMDSDNKAEKANEDTPKESPTFDKQNNEESTSIRVESTDDLESEQTPKEEDVGTSEVETDDAMEVEEISKRSPSSDKDDINSCILVDAADDTKKASTTTDIVDKNIIEKEADSAAKEIDETSESLPTSEKQNDSSIPLVAKTIEDSKIELTHSEMDQSKDKSDIEMDDAMEVEADEVPKCSSTSDRKGISSSLIVDAADETKVSTMTDKGNIVDNPLVEKEDADNGEKVIDETSKNLTTPEKKDNSSILTTKTTDNNEIARTSSKETSDKSGSEMDDAMEVVAGEVPKCPTPDKQDINRGLTVATAGDTKMSEDLRASTMSDNKIIVEKDMADNSENLHEKTSEDLRTSDKQDDRISLPIAETTHHIESESTNPEKKSGEKFIEKRNAMEVEAVEEISECSPTSDIQDKDLIEHLTSETSDGSSFSLSGEDALKSKDDSDKQDKELIEHLTSETSEFSSYSLSSEDALKLKSATDSDKSGSLAKIKAQSSRKSSTQGSSSVSPMSLTTSSEFSLSGSDSKSESLKIENEESVKTDKPPQKSTYKSPSKVQLRKSENTGRKKVLTKTLLNQQCSDSDSSSDMQVEETGSISATENTEIAKKDTLAVSKYTDSSTLKCSLNFAKKLDWTILSETYRIPPEKHVTFQNPCTSKTPEDTRMSDCSDNSFIDTQLGFKTEKEINRQEHPDTILSDSSDNSLPNADLRFRRSFHPRDVRKFDKYVKLSNGNSSLSGILKKGTENYCEKIKASFRKISFAMDKFTLTMFDRKKELESKEHSSEETIPVTELMETQPIENIEESSEAQPVKNIEESSETQQRENIEESFETQSMMSPEFSRMSMLDESDISSTRTESSDKISAEGEAFLRPKLARTTSGSFADVSEQESDSSDQLKKQKKPFCKRKTFQTAPEEDMPSKRRSLQRQTGIVDDHEMKVIQESESEREPIVSHSNSLELTLAAEKLRQLTTTTNFPLSEAKQVEMTPEQSKLRWDKFLAESNVKVDDSDDSSEDIPSGKDDSSEGSVHT